MTVDLATLRSFLDTGGPALWVIAGLSVLTLTIVWWKLWRLSRLGVWSTRRAERLLSGADAGMPGRDVYSRFVAAVLTARHALDDTTAREETGRLAALALGRLRAGLRPLELIATIAPLIGLLGTVLGMIDAFRTLQDSGGQGDPSLLAGGIWEALLTTAAGMTVAIPAAIALTWFESIADTAQTRLEDMATRIFTRPKDTA